MTAGKRRALVRSALGAMVYRLSAARVSMIADDCAALELDARATLDRAARWAAVCRAALDAGRRLPDALDATS
ncbi:MAG: hypothetical protein IPG72_05925 [Ardenticatenales bacterium]|nr:hypothetical protein [Ardenticatenales bacterium]